MNAGEHACKQDFFWNYVSTLIWKLDQEIAKLSILSLKHLVFVMTAKEFEWAISDK